jgi:hypothetical protein
MVSDRTNPKDRIACGIFQFFFFFYYHHDVSRVQKEPQVALELSSYYSGRRKEIKQILRESSPRLGNEG